MHENAAGGLAPGDVFGHLVKVFGEIHRGQVVLLDVPILKLVGERRRRLLCAQREMKESL